MTLDEAIEYFEKAAIGQEVCASEDQDIAYSKSCRESAAEHRQLAEWLKELKEFREYKAECDSYNSH